MRIISGPKETNFLYADIQDFEYTAKTCTSIKKIDYTKQRKSWPNVKVNNYHKLKTTGSPYLVATNIFPWKA
jgi:hypothetical protein